MLFWSPHPKPFGINAYKEQVQIFHDIVQFYSGLVLGVNSVVVDGFFRGSMHFGHGFHNHLILMATIVIISLNNFSHISVPFHFVIVHIYIIIMLWIFSIFFMPYRDKYEVFPLVSVQFLGFVEMLVFWGEGEIVSYMISDQTRREKGECINDGEA